jgi:hypothetical protein
MMGHHHKETPSQLFSGSSTSSVRRTSPVDLNLGGESLPMMAAGPPSALVIPSSSLPIPRFPDVLVEADVPAMIISSPAHLRRTQQQQQHQRQQKDVAAGTTGFRMTSAGPPSAHRHHHPPTPENIDHEEMSALRHLASELNAALRLSEEENLLLKGH